MWFSDSFCKIIWLSLVGIILTGCGGGGGSSSTPAPPVVVDPNLTVPLQTAMANLVNNGLNLRYTVSGWTGSAHTPLSGSGTLTIGAPTSGIITSGPLAGVTALQSVAVAGTASIIYYYNPANYTFLAIKDGVNNYIYTPYTFLSTVKAGNTGAIGSSSTGGLFANTTTGVYSVASDSANSLLVTFSETELVFGGSEFITSTTYRISTTGAITLVRVIVDDYSFGTYNAHIVRTF